jgi:transcriptional regulator with XRE-family HTH domain
MPEPDGRELSIGQRIAMHRRRLGLTQDGLAMRLHRSKSWVTKIERGERPLDSVRTLLEVARALGVEVRELTGRPWFPEPGGPGHEAVPAIRRALMALAPPPVADSDDAGRAEPRELSALEADVLAAGRLWQTEPNPFSVVVPMLPGLIAEARLAVEVATAAERRRAWRVLALLGHLGQEVLARLGEPDLSWITANQSMEAAERVGDPALLVPVRGGCATRCCGSTMLRRSTGLPRRRWVISRCGWRRRRRHCYRYTGVCIWSARSRRRGPAIRRPPEGSWTVRGRRRGGLVPTAMTSG